MYLLQLALFILFPALLVWLGNKKSLPGWLSPVILCYALGLLLANGGIFPLDDALSLSVSEAAVPLSIPLLLFTTDIISWWKRAKKAVISFGLCVLAISITVPLGAYLFKDQLPEIWKIGAMLVGVYTGGTPNMSAIGLSLDVPDATFIVLNASDMVLGGIYLLFLMTIAQKVLKRFLPKYSFSENELKSTEVGMLKLSSIDTFKQVIFSLGLGALILGVSVSLSFLIAGKITTIIVMLTVTSLGILASFWSKIKTLQLSYATGEYLLLVFCIALGSLVDINELFNNASSIFWYAAFAMFGAILIHFTLSRFLKIDADTVLITSVAAIYGPAFVGPIAKVLNNKEIILTGLTTGLIGYAIGNYWGLLMAYVLQLFL